MLLVYGVKLFPFGRYPFRAHPSRHPESVGPVLAHDAPHAHHVSHRILELGFVVRNIVLGVLQEDYIMSARAPACRRTRSVRTYDAHVGPSPDNHVPAVPAGLQLGQFIFEGIFSWPDWATFTESPSSKTTFGSFCGSGETNGIYQAGLCFGSGLRVPGPTDKDRRQGMNPWTSRTGLRNSGRFRKGKNGLVGLGILTWRSFSWSSNRRSCPFRKPGNGAGHNLLAGQLQSAPPAWINLFTSRKSAYQGPFRAGDDGAQTVREVILL
jgi:hypothetical protein